MSDWTRAFSSYSSCGGSSIPSTCCNSTEPSTSSQGASIFDGLSPDVVSTATAVGYHIDNIKRRLAAKATIVATSQAMFSVKLIRGGRVDNLTIQVGSNGQYPIIVTYTTPTDFTDYFVEVLK